MLDLQNELLDTQEKLVDRLKNLSIDHMIIAKRAKMTLYEIMKCLEISDNQRLALDFVFGEMAAFKETSAYLLYKEDFLLA